MTFTESQNESAGWYQRLWRRRRNPVRLIGRVFQKLVVGPVRYRAARGYDAEGYWRDRFATHGAALRGPGHEGLSEAANAEMNKRAAESLLTMLDAADIDLRNCSVLDIGPGAGFGTHICAQSGVRRYTGLDVTDVLFPELQRAYPTYRFLKGDVGVTRLVERFDLVFLLEVLEHIVDSEVLTAALHNAADALATNGTIVIALAPRRGSPKRFFYLRFWDIRELRARLPGFDLVDAGPWRFGRLMICRRERSSENLVGAIGPE